jgi:hypothetical protein
MQNSKSQAGTEVQQSIEADVTTSSSHNAKPLVSSSGKCSRCKTNDASDDHTCPYAEEINDDHESLCDCCADCENECCMDI